MERRIITFGYDIAHRNELDEDELADLVAASRAREEAGASYSSFCVGSALRTNDNNVFTAWNWENIVYDALHAEISSLGRIPKKSRETGLKRVTTVGALNGTLSTSPVLPCGSCRQQLLEIIKPEDNPMVIAAGIKGAVIRIALRDLLPLGFFPAEIKR